jgi:multiple sugar transport system permease protein
MSLNPAVTAANAPAVPRRRRRRRGRKQWTGWAFVGPFLVVFAFALIVPIAYAIYLSLYRQQLIGGNTFVGFDNYKTALTDPQFWASVRRVLLFLAV